MSTRGLYKLLPGTEVVDSARVVQRVTSEVAARREMAARAVTTSSINLVGESCLKYTVIHLLVVDVSCVLV